ncbi:hypothetical protein AB0H77_16875 [Streptomyces sp. NPDC050844]|uniref:effector-associated constant component EACC1 n=1 Tax=Streptomyces sp. NPDC050844 TaxID=3155790 RepID=UPI0033E87D65
MELALRVDGVVGGELEALRRWLVEERELRGRARVFMGEERNPGSMGASLEAVNVVLSNSIALAGLLTTVVAWRSSRPAPPPAVRIEVNGVSVTLNSEDPETLRALVATLGSAQPRTGADSSDSTSTSGS